MDQFLRPRHATGWLFVTFPTRGAARPVVESLEPRALLTTVVVNTVVDAIFPVSSNLISLRSALATASASTTPTTITFDPNVFSGQAIVLNGSGLVLNSAQPTTITSAGTSGVTIDGNSEGTVLQISGAGNVEIDGLQITHGSAGCVINHSKLTLNGGFLGYSTGGPGLSNFGSATLISYVVTGETSATAGGGIYNAPGATLNASEGEISANQSTDGGGIDNAGGTVVLTDEFIYQNTCTGNTSRGGGVLTQGGSMTLNRVLLYNNTSGNGGGADDALGTLSLVNCTVYDNIASADGGGVADGDSIDSGSGTTTLTNCTITGNSGRLGGGIYAASGVTTFIANTIIAGNILTGKLPVGPDADGLQASLGHNLVGKADGSVGSWNTNDLTGTTAGPLNPQLAPIGQDGGTLPTIVPEANSPAIDAGFNAYAVDSSNAPLTTDERGYPRINNGTVDIGAVEFQPQRIDIPPGSAGVMFTRLSEESEIAWSNGTTGGVFSISDPEGAVINGNGANDSISFNNFNGFPLPTPLHLNGIFTISGLVGTDPLAGSTLDIGKSTVYIPYADPASDPLSEYILFDIQNAYNNGLWSGTSPFGNGMITSAAAAANTNHSTGIGYADSSEGLVPLPANTIELKYTLYGDTALTGSVGFADFMRMTQHYTLTGQTWAKGDFNYDGTVDSNDFNLQQPNYGQTLPAPAPAPVLVMTPIVVAPVTLAQQLAVVDPLPVSSTEPSAHPAVSTTNPTDNRKVKKHAAKLARKHA